MAGGTGKGPISTPGHSAHGPWEQSPWGSARAVLGRINYFTHEKVTET